MEAENLNDNVDTLASLVARAEQGVSSHQRRIERFTAQVGQPRSFYLIVAFAVGWIGFNVVAPRLALKSFDPPPFFWLQGLVGFGALVMTIVILITQNRQTKHAGQRGQLELQINLLAEQKIAKIIALLEELRRDLPSVRDRVDRVADVMQEPVDPHAVLSALEETLEPHPEEPITGDAARSPASEG